MMPQVTWTNGKVALANDLIFGLCVYTIDDDNNERWLPVDGLSLEEVREVHRLVDWNPSCIYQNTLNEILARKEKEHVEYYAKSNEVFGNEAEVEARAARRPE